MKSKTCAKCKKEYPATREYFHSGGNALHCRCKSCACADNRDRKQKNRERFNAYNREYYAKNKKNIAEKRHKWHLENPDYYRNRFAEYPKVKICNTIASSIRKSLKNGGKNGRHWETLVGYTVDDLMAHLEQQFGKGMGWDNYGKYGWHIDHIRPKSDFHFESVNDPEFKTCWSLWNLQPMWAKENLSKQTKCEQPPLPLLHPGGQNE